MPSDHSRPTHGSDEASAISGCAGAIAAQVANGRCACGSGVAAKIPVESVAEHHRHEPQWRASLPESTHADVLLLRQRTQKTGAVLSGAVAAAHALYSGAGTDAHGEGDGYGSQPVFEHGGAMPEVSCYRRSSA